MAVQNGNNVHTDWRGYAVVPSLTAYRKNVITLDTESMADDTDVDQQGQTVIPGGGAVVMANYQTHIGNRVLFTLRNAQGPLPFGASARLVEEEESGNPPGGMVADGGGVSQRCAAGGNHGGELDRQQPVAELHAAFSSSG